MNKSAKGRGTAEETLAQTRVVLPVSIGVGTVGTWHWHGWDPGGLSANCQRSTYQWDKVATARVEKPLFSLEDPASSPRLRPRCSSRLSRGSAG